MGESVIGAMDGKGQEMAGNGGKWQEMAGNGRKWQEMTGNVRVLCGGGTLLYACIASK